MPQYWKKTKSNSYIFNYSLDLINQRSKSNNPYLWTNIGKKILLILHWNRGIKIARSSFHLIIWSQLHFYTRFCSKKLTWVLSLRSESLVFYFCWIIPLNNIIFYPLNGNLSDQKCQKVQHASISKLIFLQLCLLNFSFTVSIHSFVLETNCSFF